MLTAHKEDHLFGIAEPSPATPRALPLSGILESIRGLRILLDNLPLEDIVEADEKVQKLIQRIADFQRDLTNLSHIQKFVSTARALTERMEVPFDLGQSEADENTQKLVEKLSAVYIDLLSLSRIKNLLVRVNEITRPTEALTHAPKQESPTRLLQNQGGPLPNNLILFPAPARHPKEMTKAPVRTHSLKPFLPNIKEQLSTDSDLHHADTLQNTVSRPKITYNVAPVDPRSSDPRTPTGQGSDLQPSDQPEGLPLENTEPASEVLSPTVDRSTPSPVALENNQPIILAKDTEKHQKQDKPVDAETFQAIGRVPSSDCKRGLNRDYRPAFERYTVGFDQKFLTDVIKDYGEFVTYSTRTPPKTQETMIAPDLKFMQQPANDPSDKLDRETLPTPVVYRNEGDLDRTLKTLIRDYGEYDIYSHHNPNNLKKVIIATSAVLVLLLSLSFFYLRHTMNSLPKLSPTHLQPFSTNTDPQVAPPTPPTPAKKNGLIDQRPSLLQGGIDDERTVLRATESTLLDRKE